MSRHTHIIGLGGAGMSAIAHLLLERGERISGCDRSLNAATAMLADRGALAFAGHDPSHLAGVDRLLISSAVPQEHPEVAAARGQAIPILTRHDLWRDWSSERPVVAVAGTHGKTTTTAMTALILSEAGQQPGYLIGADVAALGGSARWGQHMLVLEADEYARTFLALTPQVGIITNIDWDHVDIYPTQAAYDADFASFARQSQSVIACGDDPGVQRVLAAQAGIRCGLEAHNHWRALELTPERGGMRFRVLHNETPLGSVWLGVPGEHNVRNALLALAASDCYGVPFATAAAALARYSGAARRFEPKGEANQILVFDDYAHHPTEIRATLAAARGRFPDRRLVVYFQPHTFSRLQAFRAEFSSAFAEADVVRIGAVYGAREAATGADPTGEIVAGMQHANVQAVGDLAGAVAHLLPLLQPNDVLLTLGAGDGVLVGERLLHALEQRR